MNNVLGAVTLVALVTVIACGSDDITGVEQPIDGSWELRGLFTDFDDHVRCWLTGEADVQLVGGGVNTMTGSGSHALECDVQGESERVENAGSIRNGRYIADEMRMLFGDCDFIGTYVPTRPNSIRGTVVTCNVALMQTGHVGLVGSWEAIRMEGP